MLAAAHPDARDYLQGVAVAHNNLGGALVDLGDRKGAADEFRKALEGYAALAADHPQVAEYRSGVALAHLHLGGTLGDLGDRVGAADELREALKGFAPLAAAHPEVSEYSYSEGIARGRLSEILRELGKPDEEITSLRETIRLKPKSAASHHNLAIYLAKEGKMDEAIDEFRETMHLDGDHVGSAAFNLGVTLRQIGRYQEVLELFRDLPKRVIHDQVHSERDKVKLIRRAEAELTKTEQVARLSALIRGDEKPKDAAEGLTFAYLAYQAKRFGPSARLYAGAFQSDPKLAEDMTDHDRYNAACAAALASAGKADDKPSLSEPEKARWRKQALDWLKSDLAHWTKQAQSDLPLTNSLVKETLVHWKADADLAAIRDEESLKTLPQDEREACRSLWAHVEALLKTARAR